MNLFLTVLLLCFILTESFCHRNNLQNKILHNSNFMRSKYNSLSSSFGVKQSKNKSLPSWRFSNTLNNPTLRGIYELNSQNMLIHVLYTILLIPSIFLLKPLELIRNRMLSTGVSTFSSSASSEIHKCEKCHYEIRPAKGRAKHLIYENLVFKCPLCQCGPEFYFNVKDVNDIRAVAYRMKMSLAE